MQARDVQTRDMQNKISPTQALLYVFKSLKPFKLSIGVMLGIAIYSGLAMSIMPFMIRNIINSATKTTHVSIFAELVIPAALYMITQVGLTVGYRLYDYFVTIKMIPAMRTKLTSDSMHLVMKQSYSFFQNNLSGNVANKVNDITGSVPDLLQIIIDRFVTLGLLITFAVITLAIVNIKFAAVMLAWVLSFVYFVAINIDHASNLAKQWAEQGSKIIGRIVDILGNFVAVKLFSATKFENQMLDIEYADAIAKERKLQWRYFFIFLYYGLTALILSAANLYLLISGRINGSVQIGDFALVMMLNITILDQLWMIAKDYAQFSKLLGRITQALTIILQPVDMVDKINATNLKVTRGEIVYDHVHFTYSNHDTVFRNKTVRIAGGQKVGLVGYSGGGKTTFVNLILRLYDINAGKILIDSQDIRDVTQDSLHAAISMIPQDPVLFHRSLLENIAYAKPNAMEEEIYAAAKKAHAHEFIVKLANGYASMVGERGIKLSGGQRQRIAIARAILKNAPILILDEATSQLDSVTEQVIQDSLWDLMQDKTTIVVAHRLSTLLHMDRILVFDQGQIVEDGPHQELLAKQGLYKTLWDAQVGGFLPSASEE